MSETVKAAIQELSKSAESKEAQAFLEGIKMGMKYAAPDTPPSNPDTKN